jgi:hypothetical protein
MNPIGTVELGRVDTNWVSYVSIALEGVGPFNVGDCHRLGSCYRHYRGVSESVTEEGVVYD